MAERRKGGDMGCWGCSRAAGSLTYRAMFLSLVDPSVVFAVTVETTAMLCKVSGQLKTRWGGGEIAWSCNPLKEAQGWC